MGSIPDKGQSFFSLSRVQNPVGPHSLRCYALFPRVRRPGREADNLPPSNAKNQHSFYLSFPLCQHAEHRKNPEYEGTKYLRNVDDCLPGDKPLYTRRLKYSVNVPWDEKYIVYSRI